MATQTTTEPVHTANVEEGTSSARKGGGPPEDAPWFGGSGFPYRANRGGGGDDGDDGGGGGGGGGGDLPPAARRDPEEQNNGTKLSGKEPVIFDGDRSKAEAFLLEWTIYRLLNGEQDIMRQAFSRVMLSLPSSKDLTSKKGQICKLDGWEAKF